MAPNARSDARGTVKASSLVLLIDSFGGSEVQACTPPLLLKKKLDNNVDASPGTTTSTSKSRKLLE
jgi:hypothetical protein